MNVRHADEEIISRGLADQYSGVVWAATLAEVDAPSRLRVARITFEPGARTAWHRHPLGQVLVALSGAGRFQEENGPLTALAPGDTVTIAPDVRHWHGASPGQLFVHLSMQQADADGQQAIWLEQVSDADYRRAPVGAA